MKDKTYDLPYLLNTRKAVIQNMSIQKRDNGFKGKIQNYILIFQRANIFSLWNINYVVVLFLILWWIMSCEKKEKQSKGNVNEVLEKTIDRGKTRKCTSSPWGSCTLHAGASMTQFSAERGFMLFMPCFRLFFLFFHLLKSFISPTHTFCCQERQAQEVISQDL